MICLIVPNTRKIQSNYTKVESRTCMLNTKTKILPYQTDSVSVDNNIKLQYSCFDYLSYCIR